jgi:hypothetical protein
MAKTKKTEKDIVDSITEIDATSLLSKAKEKYSSKYADQMTQLIEDNMRLERALKFVRAHIKRVSEGDILAIEEYLESRKKLEDE